MPSVDPPSTSIAPAPPAVPRRRRFWRIGLLSLFTVGVALALTAWLLVRATPGWYDPPNPENDAVLDAADHGQQKIALDLHNALQRVPLGEQQWSITQLEVNSLLAVKFAPQHHSSDLTPAATENPPEVPVISAPVVIFSPGQVTCAARSSKIPAGDSLGGVASVSFTVEMSTDPDGTPTGLIRMSGTWLGLLPIPKTILEHRLQSMAPSLVAAAQRAMSIQLGVRGTDKLLPQVQTAIEGIVAGKPFPLAFTYDHRKITVKEIRIDDGVLTIIFAPPTLPPPSLPAVH